MLKTESIYERMLVFNLKHRWLTPVLMVGVLASAWFPFTKVEKNFDTNESELFVQVNYNPSESLSLERKEQLVTQVEKALEPHREELMARSIYSFWSDEWSMTRIYLKEGEANEENIAAVREKLRALLPEIAGCEARGAGERPVLAPGPRQAYRAADWWAKTPRCLPIAGGGSASARIDDIPGLVDPFSGSEQRQQEIHVERRSRDGVAAWVSRAMQPAEVVGLTFRGQRLQRFRTHDGEREMRVDPRRKRRRNRLAAAQSSHLDASKAKKIPLASLATFEEKPGAQLDQPR